jgi:predicted metal-dependent peptidase
MIAIDTSASVSDDVLSAFVSELDQILTETTCLLHVVTCDTQAVHAGDFETAPIGAIHVHGRGGTSFSAPFAMAEKDWPTIDGAVYMTDGECRFPDAPTYPVLWLMSTDIEAPWGETVRLD